MLLEINNLSNYFILNLDNMTYGQLNYPNDNESV